MPKQPAKPHSLPDQLKAAIRASGLTHYRIGKDAGVGPDQIDRFMAGERDLRLETAGRIAAVLGLELTAKKKSKGA